MTDYTGLLKRLNNRIESVYDGATQGPEWQKDELCAEAAAAIRDLQARLDAVKPRPIEEAVIGERYLFYSYGQFRIVDTWCSPWKENHMNWPEPFTHCLLLSALGDAT